MRNNTSQKNIGLENRPPVVCIMGHIDHGKSTLLDCIRKTNLTEKEAGGITQRIGAYEVNHKTKDGTEKKITFLDTPGHEAFKAIRSRGTKAADIAVLVVSAEDGVMPQTVEALKVILENDVPYIVAITKIDKPAANLEKTKQSLAEHGIYIEGYGGTVPWVTVSGKSGEGVPELLDTIILMAEISELKGDKSALAEGVVVESHMDQEKGINAAVIIKNGTLKKGMAIAAEDAFAPIRIMENPLGEKLEEATMSAPVAVIGWNKIPKIGSPFKTFQNKKEAEKSAGTYSSKLPAKKIKKENENVENKKIIPLIIKTDVAGTVEAIEHEIKKIKSERVILKIIHTAVGDIGENDIKIISGKKDTLIIGFNVAVDERAKALADRDSIQVVVFNIIYELTKWLENIIKERTPKIMTEEIKGQSKILKVFNKKKDKQIVGSKMIDGEIAVGDQVKILRRNIEIGKGKIKELQYQKTKIDKALKDSEFGMLIQTGTLVAQGDTVSSFVTVEK